ncbi:MAG: hypothetical protein VR68_02635 [Peptococcaceae bacterium BRH_c4a]|nr:MAG: hypothetical protein VR68_02635 [Peptococcaceae bacterium BRH_c4a]
MGKKGNTRRRRGVSIMPTPATAGLKRVKKKPNAESYMTTVAIKKDRNVMVRIAQSRREAKLGLTVNLRDLF